MNSKKVLIIEDESNIREVYADVLAEEGFDVVQCGDGEDGLQCALNKDWDVMLLDIMLPKRDGLNILAEVKKVENLKNRPVVLLTNLGKDSIIKEGMNLGAASYLVKSEIDPDKVVSESKKLLGL